MLYCWNNILFYLGNCPVLCNWGCPALSCWSILFEHICGDMTYSGKQAEMNSVKSAA